MKQFLILTLLFFGLYYFLGPEYGLITSAIITMGILSYTDLKERYVDDQHIAPILLLSLYHSYSAGELKTWLTVNLVMFVFSFTLYILGAWSSGDVTGMLAASQIVFITEKPLNYAVNIMIYTLLVIFIVFFAYAVKKKGIRIFSIRPTTFLTTAFAVPFYALLRSHLGIYTLPVAIIIALAVKNYSKFFYPVAGTASLIVLGGMDPTRFLVAWLFFLLTASLYGAINKAKNGIFTETKYIGELKPGDVIADMVVEHDGVKVITKANLKNILYSMIDGYKIVIRPNAEGITEEEIEYLKKEFPGAKINVSKTIPVLPFMFAGVILGIITVPVV